MSKLFDQISHDIKVASSDNGSLSLNSDDNNSAVTTTTSESNDHKIADMIKMIKSYEQSLICQSVQLIKLYQFFVDNEANIANFTQVELELLDHLKKIAFEADNLGSKNKLNLDIRATELETIDVESRDNSLSTYLTGYNYQDHSDDGLNHLMLTISRLVGYTYHIYGDTYFESISSALIDKLHNSPDHIDINCIDELSNELNQNQLKQLNCRRQVIRYDDIDDDELTCFIKGILVIMNNTLYGNCNVLISLYTSLRYSQWRETSEANTFGNFFQQLLNAADCNYLHQQHDETVAKFHGYIAKNAVIFKDKLARIRKHYFLVPTRKLYNKYTQENNIFLKILLKKNYLLYNKFFNIITVNVLNLAVNNIKRYHENHQPLKTSRNNIKFTYSIFLLLFQIYVQPLRLSTINKITVIDMALACFNNDDDIFDELLPNISSNELNINCRSAPSGILRINKYKNSKSTYNPQVIISPFVQAYFRFFIKFGRKYILSYNNKYIASLSGRGRINKAKKQRYIRYINSKYLFPRINVTLNDTDYDLKLNNLSQSAAIKLNKPAALNDLLTDYIYNTYNVKNYTLNCVQKTVREHALSYIWYK